MSGLNYTINIEPSKSGLNEISDAEARIDTIKAEVDLNIQPQLEAISLKRAELENEVDGVKLDLFLADDEYKQLKVKEYRLLLSLNTVKQKTLDMYDDIAKIKNEIEQTEKFLIEQATRYDQLIIKKEQLDSELDALLKKQSDLERRVQVSAGQIGTVVSRGFRVASMITGLMSMYTSIDSNIDESFRYLGTLASNVSSLAWVASSLSASTGNFILSGMQASMALNSMYQSTQIQMERLHRKQIAQYEQELFGGDTIF